MTDINTLLSEYLDYIEIEKGRSLRTRENYSRYLKEFFEHSNIKKPNDITEEVVRKFRLDLARKNLKKITQSYYLIALRNFLKYLVKRDIPSLAPDKIELPKVAQRQIDIIEYKDLERLLKAPEGNTLRDLRDRAILETFFSTGLRLAELCSLNRDLDLEDGQTTIRGKGEKLRIVFFSNGARESIKKYLKARNDTDPALFVSISGGKHQKALGRITPRSVQRLVDYWAKRAGIPKKIHPHQIRHLFATDLLVNGADLRSVQTLLGHSNISTTQNYTHLTNKELKEIHEAFHARRRSK
ncbi:MAG: tyrosine-type recombinase/integrase [Anaplasmataceae bacterium]|nr:tyrosine-type recombinase/integrase [Anaplasmataceae bacterium]